MHGQPPLIYIVTVGKSHHPIPQIPSLGPPARGRPVIQIMLRNNSMDSCSLQLREEREMWEGSQALVRRAAVLTVYPGL